MDKGAKSGFGSKKFGFYFAIATCLLTAAAIIFTAFYSTNCIKLVIQDYKGTSTAFDNLVITSVADSFSRDFGKDPEFAKTNLIVSIMKLNGGLRYFYVYDTESNKIVFSSESDLTSSSPEDFEENIVPLISHKAVTAERKLQIGPNTLVIGLLQNRLQSDGYRKMFDNLKLFVILFLLIGAGLSAIMSKMINKPLTNLVSGVSEFAKGNFHYRLQYSGFEEIDELIEAYNDMSSRLCDLYESLEKKVEERTAELEAANLKLKETQTMMVHSEKMRSLGELVAGIAHEINNPINFIYGNIMILDNYQKDLLELVDKYTNAKGEIDLSDKRDIEEFKQKIDLEFLKSDIGDLIKSCIEGVERTKNIILDLKNFSRMEEMVISECNIPKEIDTTLNILNNKLKNRITIHKEYEENLPKIEAYGGQLNQVFMNILDNAQGAIKGTGDIFIRAKKQGEDIAIEFEDTGCGIKKEDLNKIFEPFFTTKPVGQGTGLGMSIAYRVIEAHNGKISVESEVGKGTKITLILPLVHVKKEAKDNKDA